MAFLANKEAADIFAEERNKNLMQVADVFASFPKVVEGEITLGKMYQERLRMILKNHVRVLSKIILTHQQIL